MMKKYVLTFILSLLIIVLVEHVFVADIVYLTSIGSGDICLGSLITSASVCGFALLIYLSRFLSKRKIVIKELPQWVLYVLCFAFALLLYSPIGLLTNEFYREYAKPRNGSGYLVKYSNGTSLCDQHGTVIIESTFDNFEDYATAVDANMQKVYLQVYDDYEGDDVRTYNVKVYDFQSREFLYGAVLKTKYNSEYNNDIVAHIENKMAMKVNPITLSSSKHLELLSFTTTARTESNQPVQNPVKEETKIQERNDEPQYETRTVWEDCDQCHGTGKCPYCHGEGYTYYYGQVGNCPNCQNSGFCPFCGGSKGGYIEKEFRVK